MNPVLIATSYIYDLLQDPNIELIEVWANVLYARMRKGCGRNKFISKRNLTFHLPVYYNESEYISIVKSYHPDVRKVSKSKVSKQSTIRELIQHINVSRPALSAIFEGRRANGIAFVTGLKLFTEFTSTKPGKKTDKLMERIGEQLSKAGYSDDELFGGYSLNPLDESVGDDLRSIDTVEEVIQDFMRSWYEQVRERNEGEEPIPY